MTEEKSFIDSIIEEAEERYKNPEQSHLDLILIEIRKLREQIENNFETASQERQIIKNWTLERNSMLQTRIDWLSKKLEGCLKAEEIKTLDPMGPSKIEFESISYPQAILAIFK